MVQNLKAKNEAARRSATDKSPRGSRRQVTKTEATTSKKRKSSVERRAEEVRSLVCLRTKLLPPRPRAVMLLRGRLLNQLHNNLSKTATLVTANAGYGKTTLIADFVRSLETPFVWYQLDADDADAATFLAHLAHGVREKVEGFGSATLAYLQSAVGETAQHPTRAADVFINEILDAVEERLVIVLDDYHALDLNASAHAVIDRFIAYLPEQVHIIIMSREMPPLALARLRARSQLAIIDADDLRFTTDETRELFEQVFKLALPPEQVADYAANAHGWVTALQLIRQVAERQAERASSTDKSSPQTKSARKQQDTRPSEPPGAMLGDILQQSEREIFDFFAEEVFASESASAQKLLMRLSLLESVPPEICNFFAADFKDGESSAEAARVTCLETLDSLVRRNVFISLASDANRETYRLHPMFRNFLQRRLRAGVGAEGFKREHARCAEFYLSQNQIETATHHFLAAEQWDAAARLIAEHGTRWIAEGRFAVLLALVQPLPAETVAKHPRVVLHQAEVARLRGELNAAQSLFTRAAALLRERREPEAEAEALHSLASIARRHGDYVTAFANLDAAMKLAGTSPSISIKCGNTRGLCYVARSQWAEAETEFRRALKLADETGDERFARIIAHNLGTPAGMRGEFDEALRWLRRLVRDGYEPTSPQEVTARLNIARCYVFKGDFATAETHLDAALTTSQTFGYVALLGEAFEAYGCSYRKQADWGRAAHYYELAARAYADAGVDIMRRDLPEEQALLAWQSGQPAHARVMLDKLVDARRKFEDEILLHVAQLALSRVLLAGGDSATAQPLLEAALEYFTARRLYYNEAQARFALAEACAQQSNEPHALEHLRRATELVARYGYEFWLKRELAYAAHLVALPAARAMIPHGVLEATIDKQPRSSLTAADDRVMVAVHNKSMNVTTELQPSRVGGNTTAVDLTMNMLGHLEIYRDPARPFAADAWVTKRARDILCFIASRKHRRASKDVIQDTFWGDADFDAVEKNFHPTISHIRKALNSNQAFKQNFLLFRDNDYQLNPELSYRLDIEEFDRLVAEGDAANRSADVERVREAYAQAVALYRGEFMQGSYEAWIEEQRAYYREQYARILKTLAELAARENDWTQSLHLAQTLLREDAFHEDVHCLVMRAHATLGNRLAIKEQYERLCHLLREDLGVEPSQETQAVFRELFK